MGSIEERFEFQRNHFKSGDTLPLENRRANLETLENLVRKNEKAILEALHEDMKKPAFEAYVSEVAFVLEETRFALKNLRRWARPKRVRSPWVQAVSRSTVYSEPLGVCLILGPWNYPFQLVLSPLVGALAAGNCAILKPSELAVATSHLVSRLILENFDGRTVACVEGGAETAQELLRLPFNHIFYTGGTNVAKYVMGEAAKNLTPVTLELGGKSPCIVEADVDIPTAAKRIVWGKFFNAGQTCVAPDYLLVADGVRDRLIEEMRQAITEFFGEDPRKSPDYARIINDRHFERLCLLVGGAGTNKADRYFPPTIIKVDADHRVMEEEIFGPILPVLSYNKIEDAVQFVNSRPRPLAFYVFSKNKRLQKEVLKRTHFGGGCVNDTLVHLSNPRLPFGGVGTSGMGAYHGRYSFESFSHKKGVLNRSLWFDPPLRYPPYKDRLKWVRHIMS